MRTYSFDHFQVDKTEPQVGSHVGHLRPETDVEKTKPLPSEEGLHYGRQHAQTAELYRKHREERERLQQAGGVEAEQEPRGGEAPPRAARKRREEPVIHGKEDVEQHAGSMPDESGREKLKSLAQQAVSSVIQAAREAKGRPLGSMKKLAEDAVAGALRVMREVSERKTAQKSSAQTKGAKAKKGTGKKR